MPNGEEHFKVKFSKPLSVRVVMRGAKLSIGQQDDVLLAEYHGSTEQDSFTIVESDRELVCTVRVDRTETIRELDKLRDVLHLWLVAHQARVAHDVGIIGRAEREKAYETALEATNVALRDDWENPTQ